MSYRDGLEAIRQRALDEIAQKAKSDLHAALVQEAHKGNNVLCYNSMVDDASPRVRGAIMVAAEEICREHGFEHRITNLGCIFSSQRQGEVYLYQIIW